MYFLVYEGIGLQFALEMLGLTSYLNWINNFRIAVLSVIEQCPPLKTEEMSLVLELGNFNTLLSFPVCKSLSFVICSNL